MYPTTLICCILQLNKFNSILILTLLENLILRINLTCKQVSDNTYELNFEFSGILDVS